MEMPVWVIRLTVVDFYEAASVLASWGFVCKTPGFVCYDVVSSTWVIPTDTLRD